MRLAVVGAQGYVGAAICSALQNQTHHQVIGATIENYEMVRQDSYDIIINTAMPSARFWAKNNPNKDFIETVKKTADLVYGWKFKKLIQISTISARSQLDTVYGRHKAAAEKIAGFGNNLIIRLGPMYGNTLTKGVLIDMLENKKVFVDGRSRYCFAPLEFVADWVVQNLEHTGIIEIGARNSISLEEVAKHIGVNIEFEGFLDHQEIDNPPLDFPDVNEVFQFLEKKKNKTQYYYYGKQ